MIRFDVAVVGGGPAGLSAALAASAAGASVALFDEQTEPGGELRYRLRHRPRDGDPTPVPASRTLARLLDRLAATSVEPRLGAVAWGLFPGNVLSVVDGSRGEEVAAGAIVLATGSTDAALPFPGGSLPGVWSGRAILILLNRHRVRPGRRFALVGGAETEEVAESIRLAGGEVVLVAPRGASIAAEGAAGVRAIAVDGRRTEVDAVVVAAGRHPDAALAQIAGAPLGFDAALGG